MSSLLGPVWPSLGAEFKGGNETYIEMPYTGPLVIASYDFEYFD